MSERVISVRGLGKQYQLGVRQSYWTLRDRLAGLIASPWRRVARERERFWALRDVDFDVNRGMAVGVIGRNGAGKSTLLKILSRITDPTTGRVEITGRVGSLLEVGTGFHPELTGRENIFLNGAMLGMKRREAARKFDSIVEFAGVERFLDTPVKHYSSGMYVRLAFAVAAHLEPEVLVVDEVLAVGDAAFQKRCLDRMGQLSAGEGRTVLFVSHNLASINLLTQSCLWLDEGRLVTCGPTHEVVGRYLQETVQVASQGSVDLTPEVCRRGTPKQLQRDVSFARVRLLGRSGQATNSFLEGEPIRIELLLAARRASDDLEIRFAMKTLEEVVVFKCLSSERIASVASGSSVVFCDMDPNLLRAGRYTIELFMLTQTRVVEDHLPAAISFEVLTNPRPGDNPRQIQGNMGLVRVDYQWTKAPAEVLV